MFYIIIDEWVNRNWRNIEKIIFVHLFKRTSTHHFSERSCLSINMASVATYKLADFV